VENEEGKSLLVYLRNDSPADTDEDDFVAPGNKPGNKPGAAADSEGLNLLSVIGISLAAISLSVLFLVILATSKPKKKTNKAAKTNDETAE